MPTSSAPKAMISRPLRRAANALSSSRTERHEIAASAAPNPTTAIGLWDASLAWERSRGVGTSRGAGYSPSMAEEDRSDGPSGEPAPPPPERPSPPWTGWKLVQVSAVALAALVISGAVIAGLSDGLTLTGGSEDAAAPIDTQPLRVATGGQGSGTVISDPPGIECGMDCNEEFQVDELVRLTAVPSKGSAFAGFSGDCSGTGRCTVTMDTPRSVTATFEPDRPG